MNLGFIGTGEITKAVIIGILNSKIKKKISNYLKNKSYKITVLNDNQKIIDYSNFIFLAITPEVGRKILKNYQFKKSNTVVSFISTIKLKKLKEYIQTKCQIVRAIPLPPISLGVGPIPIYPPNKKVKNFFDKIGTTIEINSEQMSLNFWTLSSMMAPYYEMLNFFSQWLIKNGLNQNKAESYVSSLFLGLSKNANQNKYKNLKELVNKSQTPKGLNEQALKDLKRLNFYKKLNISSNNILKRLKGK
jgi:pyrroline-5-carboxylate reductase